ncbi:TPA: hypothetical protein ACI1IR_004386 [Yersinia enterocolitica]
MLANLLLLVIFYFASPIILIVLCFKFVGYLAEWFGIFFPPAVFTIWLGAALLITGPSDPDSPFITMPQQIAESHLLGLSTPIALVAFGVLCLVAGAARRLLTRTK